MNFEELRKIEDETKRISATYEIFNEDSRLNHSKAARIEFLTTVKYIEKYFKSGDKILDLGAGAGEYSIYFAQKGFNITAVELAENNIISFRKKITPDLSIDLIHGNALDLSSFEDKSFDIVMLFGPLYHLSSEKDRLKCIHEAMRVCKDDGTLFFSFISNDMVILTEFSYNQNFFNDNEYDHNTFKVEDFPVVFFTVDQSRHMLESTGIDIIAAIASDGVSEMMEDKINALDDEGYTQYLKYHFYCCEKPEMLGRSNYLLYIGKKKV